MSISLGEHSADAFLRKFWQRQPLLVRGAKREFSGLLSPQELMTLAGRDDCQARVVVRRAARWEVHHGPFRRGFFRRLPAQGWSLLVQDVNHHLAAARMLLQHFDFIPHARLDDLMVSYAPAGGGVGAHFDSYDVFLLQGWGRRRWEVSAQTDLALVLDAPLKLLRNFRSQGESILHPGDMLYLPPRYAHNGVAVDECMTYSIGFRAPAWQQLGERFLDFLQDELHLAGMYQDTRLRRQKNPAQLVGNLVEHAAKTLQRIRWSRADVARFLGCYLTEPKPHVFFAPPKLALSLTRFAASAARHGLELDLRTQMLYDHQHIYLNGDSFRWPAGSRRRLKRLADVRGISAQVVDSHVLELLHGWYRAGYVWPGKAAAA